MEPTLKTFILETGERYCTLIDKESGLPLFKPTLFVTTKVRNRSLSVARMLHSLQAIAVLLKFASGQQWDLEERFHRGSYLSEPELDGLRDYCQRSFARRGVHKVVALDASRKGHPRKALVSKGVEYSRLTYVGEYLRWLAEHCLQDKSDRAASLAIEKMVRGLRARRPRNRNLATEQIDNGLDASTEQAAFDVLKPGSSLSPFASEAVQKRNWLIFLMLYYLGIRRGELLNVRIKDINFAENTIFIARRADEPLDSRTFQPLAKTLDRTLPMKDTLAKEIHNYILTSRKAGKNSNKHDYLFVTHDKSADSGSPMSISAYKRMFIELRRASPFLSDFTGHQCRHAWNERFSREMDSKENPPSHARQEQMRSYLMGWSPGSGSAARYNARFIREQANEAAIRLQQDIARAPRSLE